MFKCVPPSCHPSISRCGCRSTLDWCDLRTHEWGKGVWVYSSGYFWLTLQFVLFKSHCSLFWACTGILLLYCTILYAMCIGSCPTAMLQKHILYLLKWTPRLQLLSGPERRGVYSGVATIQGAITHILLSAYYIVRAWRAKWTKRSVVRSHHFYKTVWTLQKAGEMVGH